MSIKDATNNNTITTKARYWVAVCYPENMVENWQEEIAGILQLPFAYCIHDKDKDGHKDDRKVHVHIMVAFPNTSTYKSALSLFQSLSAPGKQCCNTCEKVNNIRYMFNYLIHDTEDCRKKHKFQYPAIERVCGNNFDIGSYEQISIADKHSMLRELSMLILSEGFTNYGDFFAHVVSNFDSAYTDVVFSYSGHLERLTKSNFQKWQMSEDPDRGRSRR